MKKRYLKPSAVSLEVSEWLMDGAGLVIPVSDHTTPEESDAKSSGYWRHRDKNYINYDYNVWE